MQVSARSLGGLCRLIAPETGARPPADGQPPAPLDLEAAGRGPE